MTAFRYAARGLKESRARLEMALDAHDDERVLAALSEQLHWMYCIGEWLKKHVGNYFDLRDTEPDGRAAGALEWARAPLTHELIEPGEARPLYPGEDVYPSDDLFPGTFWRWRSMGSRVDKYGRDEMYVEQVAHRDLLGPIDAGSRFLLGLFETSL